MKWYDSKPQVQQDYPLAWYEGNKWSCDKTTFTNFKAAREAALKECEEEIKEAQKKYNALVKMTIATCPKIENPFG